MVLFELGWGNASERSAEPLGVEPRDVLDGGELELCAGAPDAVTDQLRLEAVDEALALTVTGVAVMDERDVRFWTIRGGLTWCCQGAQRRLSRRTPRTSSRVERKGSRRVRDEDRLASIGAELALEARLEGCEDIVEARPTAVRAHHRRSARVATEQQAAAEAPLDEVGDQF
jgi:hypothetical protein